MTAVYIGIAVALLALLFVLPTLMLLARLRNDEFEAGGSWGKQIFGRRKNGQASSS